MKIATVFALVLIIAGCNSNARKNSNFDQINAQVYKDSIIKIRDSLKLDSYQRAEARQKEEAALAVQSRSHNTVRYVDRPISGQTQSQKKGWSSAAKGTAIGAGAGAITGIILDKKDGRGAVIGGVVGAGTGYVIGRSKDVKSGRVQKK